MTDHANELRRHARKIGSPAGDTPSVMAAAAAHIDAQAAEIERLRAALETVVAWGPFPETGHHWGDGHGNTRPMSYSAAYGSAGERDYMRAIARRALSAKGEKQ
jgi:hypothetical protein